MAEYDGSIFTRILLAKRPKHKAHIKQSKIVLLVSTNHSIMTYSIVWYTFLLSTFSHIFKDLLLCGTSENSLSKHLYGCMGNLRTVTSSNNVYFIRLATICRFAYIFFFTKTVLEVIIATEECTSHIFLMYFKQLE